MRIWLKWAISFSVISFLFFLVSLILHLVVKGDNSYSFVFIPYFLMTAPLSFIIEHLPIRGEFALLSIVLIMGLINSFVEGAIIGYAIEKIKSFKNKK